MSVEVNIRYEGDLHCRSVHGPSGVELITDAPVDNGGRGDAFSPTDLVATALGSCMLTIMGLCAKNNNIDIEGTTVRVVKDMVADPVRRIGSLKVLFTLPEGRRLSETERRQLQNAADTCPVKKSLHPDVRISVEFEFPE